MAREIERKFLVAGVGWKDRVERVFTLRQAYLARTQELLLRVRIADGARAFLTIKSAQPGRSRSEFEYQIPAADAEELMRLQSGVVIEKRRHNVRLGADLWEVDVFEGALAGLVIAEIELSDENAEFERPDWLGDEVTNDPRYYNANLAAEGLPSSTR